MSHNTALLNFIKIKIIYEDQGHRKYFLKKNTVKLERQHATNKILSQKRE